MLERGGQKTNEPERGGVKSNWRSDKSRRRRNGDKPTYQQRREEGKRTIRPTTTRKREKKTNRRIDHNGRRRKRADTTDSGGHSPAHHSLPSSSSPPPPPPRPAGAGDGNVSAPTPLVMVVLVLVVSPVFTLIFFSRSPSPPMPKSTVDKAHYPTHNQFLRGRTICESCFRDPGVTYCPICRFDNISTRNLKGYINLTKFYNEFENRLEVQTCTGSNQHNTGHRHWRRWCEKEEEGRHPSTPRSQNLLLLVLLLPLPSLLRYHRVCFLNHRWY